MDLLNPRLHFKFFLNVAFMTRGELQTNYYKYLIEVGISVDFYLGIRV